MNYLSSFRSKICIESGKKKLNIEHVIEALIQMNYHIHIDLLVKDPPVRENDRAKLKILANVHLTEDDEKIESNNLKKLINKKKKDFLEKKMFLKMKTRKKL